MENQKAVSVLRGLIAKHVLSDEEKEAVTKAVSMLSLAAEASASQIKKLKARREKDIEW